jgi:non-canonical purine NTP pyrophosphatase (RdgB/HAM1 family)
MWLGEVETGTTYIENARLKAAAAMCLVRRPVLAEDAGLEVDALHGLPGVRSARFAGPDASPDENNAKLLRLLAGVPDEARTARFRAVAVLLLTTGAEIVGEGTFEGSIALQARGERGFGYDPIFVPDGEQRTAAELDDATKDRVSHRGRALAALAARWAAVRGDRN